MANLVLTGTEIFDVIPVLANGTKAAYGGQTTTGAVAALASQIAEGINTVVNTASLVITSTTTLTPIPGISITLQSNSNYSITAAFPVTATGGAGVAFSLGGTAVASSLNVTGEFSATSTYSTANVTALNTSMGTTAVVVVAELVGAIQVGATGGTLTVNAGQQVSNASSTTILPNGFLQVTLV